MSADPQSRPPGADPGPEPASDADDDEASQATDESAGSGKPFTAPEGYELL
jgi:hypothetical protein